MIRYTRGSTNPTWKDARHAAAERRGLVADEGQGQCWAAIRSGLSKGPLGEEESVL